MAGDSHGRGRGYIRYVADWRLFGGTGFVILPLDADPIFFLSFGAQGEWAKAGSAISDTRGTLTQVRDMVEALEALGLARDTIGVAGLDTIMHHGDAKLLEQSLLKAHIQDATQMVEEIMVVLSDEEIACAEETQRCVVAVLDRIGDVLAPGVTERAVLAEAIGLAASLGCLDGMAHLSPETGSGTRPGTERRIQEEDNIKVFIEFFGPSGFAVELGGVFSFCEPSEGKQRKFATVVKAIDRAAELMRPGMVADQLVQAIRQVYLEDGWEIIGRRVVDFHGQGLNGHFQPDGLPGSQEVLKDKMMLNIHPGLLTKDGWGVSVTHNYIVTPDGGRALGGFRPEWKVLPR